MKKQFDVPEVEVIELSGEDVIVTSCDCDMTTNIGLGISDEEEDCENNRQ